VYENDFIGHEIESIVTTVALLKPVPVIFNKIPPPTPDTDGLTEDALKLNVNVAAELICAKPFG
jgi:hypothetical protein